MVLIFDGNLEQVAYVWRKFPTTVDLNKCLREAEKKFFFSGPATKKKDSFLKL